MSCLSPLPDAEFESEKIYYVASCASSMFFRQQLVKQGS